MELETDKMLAHIDAGVGWVTFNNPSRRNAMALEMWKALGMILESFEADPAVRVVVLRGAGGKAFVSGADISEFDRVRSNATQRASYAQTTEAGRQWLDRLTKPLLALIEGFCLGGGLALAMAADIRFATPDSRFGIPAARLGLGYEYAGLKLLTSLVGPARARDILFSGRMLDADEAHAMGLVNFVSARESVDASVRDYAANLAANAPLTIAAAKFGINATQQDPAERDLGQLRTMINACFDSEDYVEGRAAFSAKRPPAFKGR